MCESKRVFISYAHDTEQFSNEVLAFSNKMRENNIDASIDQYEECPSEGWPRWMENEIDIADFVLIICTETYYNRVKNYEREYGKGVNWEINIIYQHLYDGCCNNQKYIPIIFNNYPCNNILNPLKSSTFYYIDREKDFKKLCNRIKGIRNVVKPGLGQKENEIKLKPKSRKNLIVTSFIDVPSWDGAKWGGVSYLFDPNNQLPPILALTFENFTYAKKIFDDWKLLSDNKVFNDIEVYIIEGELEQVGEGYFVFITTNIDKCIEKAEKQGLSVDENMMLIISRYQHMQTTVFSNNLDVFKRQFKKIGKYYLAPAYFKDGVRSSDLNNINVNIELAIEMDTIHFIHKEELTPDHPAYVIIQEPNPKQN